MDVKAQIVTIKLVCAKGKVFIPNAFTTNGDKINDIFYVKGKGVRSIKSMRVFNQREKFCIEVTNCNIEDPSKRWDGHIKTDLQKSLPAYII